MSRPGILYALGRYPPEVIEIEITCDNGYRDGCSCNERRPMCAQVWHCYHEMRCKYGVFLNPEANPTRECGIQPLILVTPDYIKKLLVYGPQQVASHVPQGTQSAYVGDDGWFYTRLDYEGQQWVWRLYEGRWWDDHDMPMLVGRWPD